MASFPPPLTSSRLVCDCGHLSILSRFRPLCALSIWYLGLPSIVSSLLSANNSCKTTSNLSRLSPQSNAGTGLEQKSRYGVPMQTNTVSFVFFCYSSFFRHLDSPVSPPAPSDDHSCKPQLISFISSSSSSPKVQTRLTVTAFALHSH